MSRAHAFEESRCHATIESRCHARGRSLRLLAYWALEEGTGVSPKVDATGNGHDLSGSTGITQVAGQVNFGQSFGSAGVPAGLLNASYPAGGAASLAFSKSQGFTLCAWVYFTGTSFIMSSFFPSLDPSGSPTNSFRFSIGAIQAATVRLSISQKLGAAPLETQFTDKPFPTLNAWHFVRGWWNPSDGLGRLAIDEGTPAVAAVPIGLNWPGDVIPMTINIGKGTSQPTMGLDEIGYWKGIFTPAQAAHVYNAGAGQTYPNLPGV